jgi:hypothetical protein
LNNPLAQLVLSILLLQSLIACAAPLELTFDQARETAVVAGCWPGNGQTPLPVTVTPLGGFAVTPDPLMPTPTVLPSSTPYPRCTPVPGEPTLAPYPAAAPTQPPFPTLAPFTSREGEEPVTAIQVAETILSVDAATHPIENWPVVAAVAAPLITKDAPRAWVRAFDPTIRRWRDATSLGSGSSGIAPTRFRTVRVGVAGDSSILAVWGVVTEPRLGLMASVSHDYGITWSTPVPIARRTYGILDLAMSSEGLAVALAISEEHQQPILIRRDAAGTWFAPEALPIPAWYGSVGALSIVGDGQDAQIVAVTSGGGLGSDDNTLFLLSRPFTGDEWSIERRTIASPDDRTAGLLTNLRATPLDTGRVLFTYAMAGRATVFAVLAAESGQSWGSTEIVAHDDARVLPFPAAAYLAKHNRIIVFRVCCGDATFVSAEATHYPAARRANGSWAASATPLISGAVAAADTASAQAYGAQSAWLAWVENVHSVKVRAVDLGQTMLLSGR